MPDLLDHLLAIRLQGFVLRTLIFDLCLRRHRGVLPDLLDLCLRCHRGVLPDLLDHLLAIRLQGFVLRTLLFDLRLPRRFSFFLRLLDHLLAIRLQGFVLRTLLFDLRLRRHRGVLPDLLDLLLATLLCLTVHEVKCDVLVAQLVNVPRYDLLEATCSEGLEQVAIGLHRVGPASASLTR